MKLYVFETYEDSYGSMPKAVFADSLEEAEETLKKEGYSNLGVVEVEIAKGKVIDLPYYIE